MPMFIDLETKPTLWDGTPVTTEDEPTDLRALLLQALASGPGPENPKQPTPPTPKSMMERLSLMQKIRDFEGELVELATAEVDVIEKCIAATWPQPLAIAVMAALHSHKPTVEDTN